MSPEEKKESLEKYDKRETFWSQQSLQQLGYSINFFLTIGVGFLAYIITKRDAYPKFQFIRGADVAWRLVFYYALLLIIFISVAFGTMAIIVRLYDLRITRHITSIRKNSLKKFDRYLPEGYIDLSNDSFFKSVFLKIRFIHINAETKYDTVSKEFDSLRKQAKILSKTTWTMHHWQIGLFMSGIVLFGLIIL